jgi:membrane fusion protein (multidrug efflux system)
MRLAICMLWPSPVLVLPAYGQQKAPEAISVGTVIVERKPIEKSLDFVGRVEAIDHVKIKARVTGYLDALHFKEGAQVEEGQLLYTIEKAPFEAAVKEAAGALERAKSAKALTEGLATDPYGLPIDMPESEFTEVPALEAVPRVCGRHP